MDFGVAGWREIIFFCILLVITLCTACRIFGLKFNKKSIKSMFKSQTVKICIFIVLVLFTSFFPIHFLFCYQIGFPASLTQDNSEHLVLEASDWLGFLSGYLGFAGSMLMSIVVYFQTREINKLTIAEYKPTMSVNVVDYEKSSEYDKNKFNPNSFAQLRIKTNSPYYAYVCEPVCGNSYGSQQKDQILVFVNILNKSKTEITNLSFLEIEIKELKENGSSYRFCNRNRSLDPADGNTAIFPVGTVKRCFTIKGFPEKLEGVACMQFKFSCSHGEMLSNMVFLSQDGGELVFLDPSE